MRADAFLDLPVFDNPATRFCAGLSKQLDRHEWALLNPALHQAMLLVARCLRRDDNGIRLPDRAEPGHVFLIFANGDGDGCSCGGYVEIDELEAAREATICTTAQERRGRLLELTKTAIARRRAISDARSRALAIEAAGLLIEPADIDAFGDVDGVLPAFVVLTTRKRGRSLVRWRTVTTTLPGSWLGVKSPAGTA